MTSRLFFIFSVALATIVSATTTGEYGSLFENWVRRFNIRFEDDFHRGSVFSKWVSNHVYIQKINSLNLTYTLGHNQFSGMDSIDFSTYLMSSSMSVMTSVGTPVGIMNEIDSTKNLRGSVDLSQLPSSIDWVAKGAVTPVKDQGQCGSCWSFSTTGALEGAYYIKYGELKSFSEQQLVSCDNLSNGGKDHGCNGGLMDNAFVWISKNGGLCLSESYPYVSGTTKSSGVCEKSCKLYSGSNIKSYVDVPQKSDVEMMSSLQINPLSIAIEADQKDFQLYKSGILTSPCGTNLDHGVLLVGYGTDNGIDYYKVKNSWSNSWGENGYIRLARGSQYNNGAGQCGILLQASYPIL